MVGRILAHGGHNRAVGQCQWTVGRGEGEFREEVAQGELQKQKSLRIRQAGIVIRYASIAWHLRDMHCCLSVVWWADRRTKPENSRTFARAESELFLVRAVKVTDGARGRNRTGTPRGGGF